MTNWSKFTDTEIRKIKKKIHEKSENAMKITLLLSPILILIIPFIPGRRGRMIEKMDYKDAVLQFGIIWFLIITGVWIWNNYKIKKQFSKNRQFLRKKDISTIIKEKQKSILSTYENQLITELKGDLKIVPISKEQTQNLAIGDKIKLEFEENTKTILKITKLAK